MATIMTAIRLQDQVTPAIRSMATTMNIIINTFEELHNVSGHAINTASLQTGREELAKLNVIANQVEESLQQDGNAQKRFNRHIRDGRDAADGLWNKMKGMALALGAGLGVKKVIELSDNLASTQARLSMIADSQNTVAGLQDKIFASAQRSRGAYQATADAVAKMGILAPDAFGSNDEIIGFMEQLNKQFVISGTSTEGMNAAMLQITQAMGAGVLRGEELNSVFEQAPTVVQSIADYLDVPVGKIREMAQEGEITASVVKNALFSTAEATNAKFESMPMTFAQIWESIKNEALRAFEPILQRLNQIANSEKFKKFVSNLIQGLQGVAATISQIFEVAILVGNFIADNWSIIEPIVWGVVVAVTAWKAAQALLNIIMSANPITAILTGISLLVAGILYLAKKLGGFSVLWNYAWAAMWVGFLYVKAAVVSGFWWMVYGLMWAGDKLVYAWEEIKMCAVRIFNAIADFFGQIGASILLGLESVVNGAIGILNGCIDGINAVSSIFFIPEIGHIGEVDFGREAQKAADEAANNRAKAYMDFETQVANDRQNRQDGLTDMANKASSAWTDNVNAAAQVWQDAVDYQNKVQAEQEKATGESNNPALSGISNQLGDINDNTKKTSDNLEISGEDLKYLRDIAERDVINRFTTAEIKVEMTNNNTIHGSDDLDGMFDRMGEKLRETMESAREGV